ncbi:hypothetical protein I5I01_gp32 [Mycobacterium phage MooMoo]|uniref:Uncharacterized protein n=1 Tax=Mycobacterium phage MooMoo TaxID=2108127 RepID=A0A2P1JR52_9CAUD|nr:hypothetical protein I5I01_gp32 [Mycobacterium phage MooMoo]AVO21638.1 hypothetical protein SEA_MOOMOO_32 [Mycobacterium phage MooMoo]
MRRFHLITWLVRPHLREVAQANRSAEIAEAEKVASEVRFDRVRSQAEKSTVVNANLRRELARNGWTEMLQSAWEARA